MGGFLLATVASASSEIFGAMVIDGSLCLARGCLAFQIWSAQRFGHSACPCVDHGWLVSRRFGRGISIQKLARGCLIFQSILWGAQSFGPSACPCVDHGWLRCRRFDRGISIQKLAHGCLVFQSMLWSAPPSMLVQ